MTAQTNPDLIKGLQAEYTPAKWTGADTSDVIVIGPQVLVLCDEIAEITSGDIILPADYAERMNMAGETGVIASVADGAFRIFEDGHPWTDPKPKPGDRVYFERYAGRLVPGMDGKTYRIMDYRCIGAIYKRATKLAGDDQIEVQQTRETA